MSITRDEILKALTEPGVNDFLLDRACQNTDVAIIFLRQLCEIIGAAKDDKQRNAAKDAMVKKASQYDVFKTNLESIVNETKKEAQESKDINKVVLCAMIYGTAKDVIDKSNAPKSTVTPKMFGK